MSEKVSEVSEVAIRFVAPRPASEAQVASVEDRANIRLPELLRDLLLSISNGGRVEPVAAASNRSVGLVAVLGVSRGDHLDLERRWHEYADRLPENLMPVADAEGGNLVCVSLRDQDRGTVWFWDHEISSSDDNVQWLSIDIGSFIDDLAPLSDEELPGVISGWVDPAILTSFRDDEAGRE